MAYDFDDRIKPGSGYSYNADGNLTADPSHAYFYDWDGKMTGSGASGATTPSTTYAYTADGLRAQQAASGTITIYTVSLSRTTAAHQQQEILPDLLADPGQMPAISAELYETKMVLTSTASNDESAN